MTYVLAEDPQSPPERRPGDFRRDRFGTPWVADASGDLVKSGERKGQPKLAKYSRPSGYGELIQSTYNLQKWAERMVVAGFVLGLDDQTGRMLDKPPAFDEESDDWREFADTVAVRAKERAQYMLAAERGTHAHELTEHHDTERDPIALLERGESLGIGEGPAKVLLSAWRNMLERYGMEVLATELPVVNDTYRCAGTLDRIVRLGRPLQFTMPTGELVKLEPGSVVVLDIKTGKLREKNGQVSWWSNYPIQIAIYAGGSGYDPDTDTRAPLPWPVDQQWAIIAHLDVLAAMAGEEHCELILVDLGVGRTGADLVKAAKAYDKADKFSLLGMCDLVDAKPERITAQDTGAQPGPPDEGATLDQVDEIRARYLALSKLARTWIGSRRIEAVQAHLDFHLSQKLTARRAHIMDGLIVIAAGDLDGAEDRVRALCADVVGDDALALPSMPAGVVVGSLDATQARAFASACRSLIAA